MPMLMTAPAANASVEIPAKSPPAPAPDRVLATAEAPPAPTQLMTLLLPVQFEGTVHVEPEVRMTVWVKCGGVGLIGPTVCAMIWRSASSIRSH